MHTVWTPERGWHDGPELNNAERAAVVARLTRRQTVLVAEREEETPR